MGFFEAVLIGPSAVFGLVLAGGPIIYIANRGNELSQFEKDQREIRHEWRKIQAEANRAQKILNDYSFKIFLPCNQVGTGWILDYEIPEEIGQYPRKWYIATSAKVASQFKFSSNPYAQTLPSEKWDNSKVSYFPKTALDDGITCNFEKRGYFDLNLARAENGEELGSNYGAINSNLMEEPKLFYAAIDLFEKNKGIEDNNYKDFAVIEVEFKTDNIARKATSHFYEKYVEKERPRKPLDVFAFSWDKENIREEIIDYYSLGYQNNNKFSYTFSYDKERGRTSQLANGTNSGLSVNEGRISVKAFEDKNNDKKTKWNNKDLNGFGHFYLLDNFEMGEGASGGLVIGSDRRVLGIRSGSDATTQQTRVVPLWSDKVDANSFNTPAYDLIGGNAEGQKSSYRKQVENHIFTKQKNTWLSVRGKWKEAWEKKNNKLS